MRTERLTPMLIKLLTQMQDAVHKQGRYSIHPERDMVLTYSERANFQKLRYFGLIAKDDDKASGHWIFTHLATDFLSGKKGISTEVQVEDNHIVGRSEQLRWFDGVDLTEKPFLLTKPDYVAQKQQPQLGFFVDSGRYRIGL